MLIQTRWHEDDLAGRLLREHPADWELLSMPAIAETDESFRSAGEALWPQKFPLDVLEQIRIAIGGSAWLRSISNALPLPRERFSEENGGAFSAISRYASVWCKVGTPLSRPVPKTTTLRAQPGV